MIGRKLAHYEILEKVGAGGMGEVYRARDTQLDRDVAIKILPEMFTADPDRLARFEREAKVLASLNHAGIAVIHGLHEEGGVRFLAMELVPGEDLAQRLRRGSLSVEDAIDIARQVAEALEAAHEQGIIHRDLKPANIVLTAAGKTKVLDFGLAKSVEVAGSEPDLSQSPTLAAVGTMQGVILGTAAYMSPEQARGRPVDKRSDIWSYGVILYELFTGRQPFGGDTVSDVMAGVLKSPIDFDSLPAATPRAVVSLMRRCLDRDPATRLRDIGEARIILGLLRAGEIEVAEAAPDTAPPVTPLRAFGGWIVAGVALVLATAVFLMQPAPTPDPIPLRKSTIPMSREDVSLKDQFHPAISPDGRYLVYTSGEQLWLRDLTTIGARPLAGTEGAANPFWSPDSEWIGFGVEQSVRKVSREGGSPALVGRMPASQSVANAGSGGAWSASGRLLLGTGFAGLLGVAAQGGEVTTALQTAEGETDFHEVSPLPDGRGFIFVVHHTGGYGALDVLTPDGDRKPVLRIDDDVESPGYSPTGHVIFRRTGDSAGIWALPFSLERLEPTGEPFLVAVDGQRPSVSRDGTLAYVTGTTTRKARMAWFDRTGNLLEDIGPVETVRRPFPELTADDRWLFHAADFGDSREVYRYDLSSRNRQRITFNDLREDVVEPHPNGTDIIYYESNSFQTYAHSLTGAAEPRDLFHGIMARMTPDGSRIVFSRNKPDTFDWDILVRDYDGGDDSERTLVSSPGLDWWPQISPDGRYLMYVSDETGHEEVYVTNFPDASTRWQVSTDGGEMSRWSADGREILYTTRNAIMAVDVNTEDGLTLGTPRELFVRPRIDWSTQWADGFDVSADGQRFVLFRPVMEEDGEQPAIVIVQNWFSEFAGDAPGAAGQ